MQAGYMLASICQRLWQAYIRDLRFTMDYPLPWCLPHMQVWPSEQRARAGSTLTHRFKSIPLVQLPLHHRLMWFCSCWTWFWSFGITKGSGIYTKTTRGGSVSRFLGYRWWVECFWDPSRLQIRTGAKVRRKDNFLDIWRLDRQMRVWSVDCELR